MFIVRVPTPYQETTLGVPTQPAITLASPVTGDIVQFDWDNSGDRDHTGIVSKVEGSGDGISISYASHTEDADYRTVDFAITERHPGGTAYYWSVP